MLLIIINTKWYERFLEFFCSSIVVFECLWETQSVRLGLRLPANASRAVDDAGMTTRWECCAWRSGVRASLGGPPVYRLQRWTMNNDAGNWEKGWGMGGCFPPKTTMSLRKLHKESRAEPRPQKHFCEFFRLWTRFWLQQFSPFLWRKDELELQPG